MRDAQLSLNVATYVKDADNSSYRQHAVHVYLIGVCLDGFVVRQVGLIFVGALSELALCPAHDVALKAIRTKHLRCFPRQRHRVYGCFRDAQICRWNGTWREIHNHVGGCAAL